MSEPKTREEKGNGYETGSRENEPRNRENEPENRQEGILPLVSVEEFYDLLMEQQEQM